jgi:netrin 1
MSHQTHSFFFKTLCRSYLILGVDASNEAGSLVVGPKSVIIEWKDDWMRRVRRYQQLSTTGCY